MTRHLARVVIEAKGTVPWRAFRSDTSRRWVAICDAMNLTTEADTLDELHSLISESVHLLLADLLRDNELEAFLQERGWHALNLPTNPSQNVQFDVPLELIVAAERTKAHL